MPMKSAKLTQLPSLIIAPFRRSLTRIQPKMTLLWFNLHVPQGDNFFCGYEYVMPLWIGPRKQNFVLTNIIPNIRICSPFIISASYIVHVKSFKSKLQENVPSNNCRLALR